MKMHRSEVNGIILEYDSFGAEDSEPILLISGLGIQMIGWNAPFCEILAAHGYRVIRFDNRDVGLSTHFDNAPVPNLASVAEVIARGDQPDVPYTLHDMADDAVGLLDALSIKQAHIVGRSMGGMIAQLVASEHPSHTLSLAAIMSSTGNSNLPSATPEVMTMLSSRPPHPLEDEAGFLAHSIAFARMIASPAHPFDETAQKSQILTAMRRAYNPAGFARQIAAIAATGDLRASLGSITVPTLVVHGSDDPLVPMTSGKDIAANIQNADLLIIEGMGHELPPVLYDTVASAIVQNACRAPSCLR
jgi:pimeloyl-ACP methyl ester carboxylesterase